MAEDSIKITVNKMVGTVPTILVVAKKYSDFDSAP